MLIKCCFLLLLLGYSLGEVILVNDSSTEDSQIWQSEESMSISKFFRHLLNLPRRQSQTFRRVSKRGIARWLMGRTYNLASATVGTSVKIGVNTVQTVIGLCNGVLSTAETGANIAQAMLNITSDVVGMLENQEEEDSNSRYIEQELRRRRRSPPSFIYHQIAKRGISDWFGDVISSFLGLPGHIVDTATHVADKGLNVVQKTVDFNKGVIGLIRGKEKNDNGTTGEEDNDTTKADETTPTSRKRRRSSGVELHQIRKRDIVASIQAMIITLLDILKRAFDSISQGLYHGLNITRFLHSTTTEINNKIQCLRRKFT